MELNNQEFELIKKKYEDIIVKKVDYLEEQNNLSKQ